MLGKRCGSSEAKKKHKVVESEITNTPEWPPVLSDVDITNLPLYTNSPSLASSPTKVDGVKCLEDDTDDDDEDSDGGEEGTGMAEERKSDICEHGKTALCGSSMLNSSSDLNSNAVKESLNSVHDAAAAVAIIKGNGDDSGRDSLSSGNSGVSNNQVHPSTLPLNQVDAVTEAPDDGVELLVFSPMSSTCPKNGPGSGLNVGDSPCDLSNSPLRLKENGPGTVVVGLSVTDNNDEKSSIGMWDVS